MKIDPETEISKIIDGLTISCGKIEKTMSTEFENVSKKVKH